MQDGAEDSNGVGSFCKIFATEARQSRLGKSLFNSDTVVDTKGNGEESITTLSLEGHVWSEYKDTGRIRCVGTTET